MPATPRPVPAPDALALYERADLLIHDSTYTAEDRARYPDRGLASASEAVQAAVRAPRREARALPLRPGLHATRTSTPSSSAPARAREPAPRSSSTRAEGRPRGSRGGGSACRRLLRHDGRLRAIRGRRRYASWQAKHRCAGVSIRRPRAADDLAAGIRSALAERSARMAPYAVRFERDGRGLADGLVRWPARQLPERRWVWRRSSGTSAGAGPLSSPERAVIYRSTDRD